MSSRSRQLAALPDKWPTSAIFFLSWRFANHHYVGVRISLRRTQRSCVLRANGSRTPRLPSARQIVLRTVANHSLHGDVAAGAARARAQARVFRARSACLRRFSSNSCAHLHLRAAAGRPAKRTGRRSCSVASNGARRSRIASATSCFGWTGKASGAPSRDRMVTRLVSTSKPAPGSCAGSTR